MPAFSNIEYRHMVFIYEHANGNANEAILEYGLRFLNKRKPNRKTFVEVFRRLGETDLFRGLRIREGGRNTEQWQPAPAILQAV